MTNEKPYLLRMFERYSNTVYKGGNEVMHKHLMRAFMAGALTMATLQRDYALAEIHEMEGIAYPNKKQKETT